MQPARGFPVATRLRLCKSPALSAAEISPAVHGPRAPDVAVSAAGGRWCAWPTSVAQALEILGFAPTNFPIHNSLRFPARTPIFSLFSPRRPVNVNGPNQAHAGRLAAAPPFFLSRGLALCFFFSGGHRFVGFRCWAPASTSLGTAKSVNPRAPVPVAPSSLHHFGAGNIDRAREWIRPNGLCFIQFPSSAIFCTSFGRTRPPQARPIARPVGLLSNSLRRRRLFFFAWNFRARALRFFGPMGLEDGVPASVPGSMKSPCSLFFVRNSYLLGSHESDFFPPLPACIHGGPPPFWSGRSCDRS